MTESLQSHWAPSALLVVSNVCMTFAGVIAAVGFIRLDAGNSSSGSTPPLNSQLSTLNSAQ